jgi:hypothetical protein
MSDFYVTWSLLTVANLGAPACPLPIIHPILSEAHHPALIDKQTVGEVEVLYLMLTACHVSKVSAEQPVLPDHLKC